MPLQEEIAELLMLPEDGSGAPSLAAIEATLTDGYAEALVLEVERSRIERRLGEAVRNAGNGGNTGELALLSERLSSAEGELARLRSQLRSLQERARVIRAARA
jgi:hypothetical protein